MGLANVELAADWVGALLAHLVEIPTPDVSIADVDADALATTPPEVQAWAHPGPAFASHELIQSDAISSDDLLLEFATADEIGCMFALDAWLDVVDRKRPDGIWNLLVETNPSGRICVIDFGKGLTQATLPLVGSSTLSMPDYPLGVRLRASLDAAYGACDRIEALTKNDILEVVASTPEAWLGQDSRERVKSFLLERQFTVRAICSRLHDVGAG